MRKQQGVASASLFPYTKKRGYPPACISTIAGKPLLSSVAPGKVNVPAPTCHLVRLWEALAIKSYAVKDMVNGVEDDDLLW
jgi:hypothetical protein